MTITVTTYGKFEELRKNLVNDLLNDNNLSNKMNQKILESALFTDVVTACEAASSVYINDNMERWKSEPDNVMRETYNAYLEPFLSALSDALKIEESCLEIHVSVRLKKMRLAQLNKRCQKFRKLIKRASDMATD